MPQPGIRQGVHPEQPQAPGGLGSCRKSCRDSSRDPSAPHPMHWGHGHQHSLSALLLSLSP